MKATEAQNLLKNTLDYSKFEAEEYFEANRGKILEVIRDVITKACLEGKNCISYSEIYWEGFNIEHKPQIWYITCGDLFCSLVRSLGYVWLDGKWTWSTK